MPPRLPIVSHPRHIPRTAAFKAEHSSSAGVLFDLLTPALSTLRRTVRHATSHQGQEGVYQDKSGTTSVETWGAGQEDGVAGPSNTERDRKGKGKQINRPIRPVKSFLSLPSDLYPESSASTRKLPARSTSTHPPPDSSSHRSISRALRQVNPPSPDSLLPLYHASYPSRSKGDLLARYSRRVDNLRAERNVKDAMARARIGPISWLSDHDAEMGGSRGMRMMSWQKLDGWLCSLEQKSDVPEYGDEFGSGTGWAGDEGNGVADENNSDMDEMWTDSDKKYTVVAGKRIKRSLSSRGRSSRTARIPLSVDPAILGINNLNDPLHRVFRTNQPDRSIPPGTKPPIIRAVKAWKPLSDLPLEPTPHDLLCHLHYRLINTPTDIPDISTSLSEMASLLDRLPTPALDLYLRDVLHLYLSYTSDGISLLDSYIAFRHSRIQSPLPHVNAQTLHLSLCAILRSRRPMIDKESALRGVLERFDKWGIRPLCESIRHLIKFCLLSNDRKWAGKLYEQWWQIYTIVYDRHYATMEGSTCASTHAQHPWQDSPSPSPSEPSEPSEDQHKYDHIHFRFARRGVTWRRWLRLLRRLERRGWTRNTSGSQPAHSRWTFPASSARDGRGIATGMRMRDWRKGSGPEFYTAPNIEPERESEWFWRAGWVWVPESVHVAMASERAGWAMGYPIGVQKKRRGWNARRAAVDSLLEPEQLTEVMVQRKSGEEAMVRDGEREQGLIEIDGDKETNVNDRVEQNGGDAKKGKRRGRGESKSKSKSKSNENEQGVDAEPWRDLPPHMRPRAVLAADTTRVEASEGGDNTVSVDVDRIRVGAESEFDSDSDSDSVPDSRTVRGASSGLEDDRGDVGLEVWSGTRGAAVKGRRAEWDSESESEIESDSKSDSESESEGDVGGDWEGGLDRARG